MKFSLRNLLCAALLAGALFVSAYAIEIGGVTYTYYPNLAADTGKITALTVGTLTTSTTYMSATNLIGTATSAGALSATTGNFSGAVVANSTLKLKGAATLDGAVTTTGTLTGATVAATGAATVGTTLAVTGASTLTGGATLGANGTALTTLRIVRVTVANGATSGTATGTGLTANSKVVGQCLTAATTNACYVKYAKCEAGAVDAVVNTDPGASTAVADLLIAN